MLHCWFSPPEAFEDVFWIYAEQDGLGRQETEEIFLLAVT